MPVEVEDVDLALPEGLAVVALVYGFDGDKGRMTAVLGFNHINQGAQRYFQRSGQTRGASSASFTCRSRISCGPQTS